MCQNNRQINVCRTVAVTDQFNFSGSLLYIDQRSDQFVLTGHLYNIIGENSDEKDPHSADLPDQIWQKQPAVVQRHIQIGVDDWKTRALFQKQQMGQPVIHFMISNGHHIRFQLIDKIDR